MTRISLATRLADFGRDARVAARSLSRDRTFTVTALLTLIVCLGGERGDLQHRARRSYSSRCRSSSPTGIVLLSNIYPKAGYSVTGPGIVSAGVPDYFDRLRETTVFEEQALYVRHNPTLGLEDGAQRVPALSVTPSFFPLLRVARLSRVARFSPKKAKSEQNARVILSYGFWQRQFGGDSSIIGKDIRSTARRVVSSACWRAISAISGTTSTSWYPLTFTPEPQERRLSAQQQLDRDRASQARRDRRAGTAPDRRSQRAQQSTLSAVRHHPARRRFPHAVVTRLDDAVTRDVRPTLYLLWGGVLLVLLVGGVNLANLTLVRSAGRARELATRHALGAELPRLARQLLTETTLLTLIGGALGTVAGWWILRSMKALHLELLPRGDEIGLDWQTALVMIALAVVRRSRRRLRARRAAAPHEHRRGCFAKAAAAAPPAAPPDDCAEGSRSAQVALAFVLLIGAGLLLASFRAVLRIDPGIQLVRRRDGNASRCRGSAIRMTTHSSVSPAVSSPASARSPASPSPARRPPSHSAATTTAA